MFHAQIITLFPEYFSSPFACSIPKRAIEADIVTINTIQIRDFATDKHRQVDDAPYGGGPGMVIKPEPVVAAIREARKRESKTHVILLSPCQNIFNQNRAHHYATLPGITLVCGRYEGIDERVVDDVDEVLSIGNYVLSGGEPAAFSILDSIIRLLPGALGDAESAQQDSFTTEGVFDWPHYTRPELFEGKTVPKVLLSGNHAAILAWREAQASARSKK